jgi:hypothetical protein
MEVDCRGEISQCIAVILLLLQGLLPSQTSHFHTKVEITQTPQIFGDLQIFKFYNTIQN